MNRKTLPLEKIQIDGGTQARASLDEGVVAEYAEAITSGVDMPPVTVFQDGKRYWLADGFHRFHAHRAAGAIQIEADVRTGTRRDAILHSVGANASHGLRRSNADKRCAVKTLLADKVWGSWTDRQIADACGVSHPFVASLRNPARAAEQKAARDASAARKVESDSTHASVPATDAPPTAPVAPAAPSQGAPLPTASNDCAKPGATPPPAEADVPSDHDDVPHGDDEEVSELDSLRQQVVELTDILAGFDAVAAGEKEAAAEITRLTGQLRVVESQRDQYMHTCNEIKRQVKALQRENARLLALVPKEAA